MSARMKNDDRGNVIPIVALSLVMLLTMVAFAVDLGNARQAKALAASTTDAAALAGAQAIAGVKSGGTPPVGMTQPVYDAASWAFRNLSATLPANPSKPCDGNSDKTCFSSGDSRNIRVEVTTPYCPSGAAATGGICPTTVKTQPDGTPYTASQLLHVKTCWDEATAIAKVIGVEIIRVCSEATARAVGKIVVNTDQQDATNDPFARCSVDSDIFDPNKYFDGGKPSVDIPKQIPGHNNYGATYLYTTDLNPASVKFDISSNTAFAIGGQAAAKDHTFDSTSPYVSIVYKNQDAQGRYKWELKFTNFTGTGSNGLPNGAKNFKDTLPDGQYTFAVYAETNSTPPLCHQEVWSVTINNTKAANVGLCQEDLFRGGFGTVPSSGAQVKAGDTLVATYYDETRPFKPELTDTPEVRSHGLIFRMTGSDGNPQDLTLLPGYSPTPADGRGLPNGGSGEYKWKQEYKYVLPSNLATDQYLVEIQIYDSDQNKTGGDCGYAKWTINFSGQDGKVELVD
jgi:hypothetical protein